MQDAPLRSLLDASAPRKGALGQRNHTIDSDGSTVFVKRGSGCKV
jgi:hypothetical protein